ncbi:hypothetical protein BCON_0063g00380 [Botryotinia convoluta]|uniref:Kinesin-like protein n=1 Tax=Botryotinia convoluta TaxID=54673 RepID=A0A4Z1I7W6_9HELO|nr:hypothetical protein BCON_0063g00380 [Botryotinia convoluta]
MSNNDSSKTLDQIITPAIHQVLAGSDYNIFVYGHSSSGKSHFIVGYEYEQISDLGLCLAAEKGFIEALGSNSSYQDSQNDEHRIGMGFSIFGFRNNTAFDLLNGRIEYLIREGSDGKTHLRGETELLHSGKEERAAVAKEKINAIISQTHSPRIGGKMIFVDLAGAEYQQIQGMEVSTVEQTSRERQEDRQINTNLLALKEVMRAWSAGRTRIRFRSSPLTMVLQEHFTGCSKGASAMIVNLASTSDQYSATLNCLKYGSLIIVARLKN